MSIFVPVNIIENYILGAALIAPDHRVQFINRRFEKMFGYDRQKAVGLKIEQIIPSDNQWNWAMLLSDGEEKSTKILWKKTIQNIEITANIQPILGPDGSYSYVIFFNDSIADLHQQVTAESKSASPTASINLEELNYIASLPEMANTSNTSEEFLARAQMRLIRTFRYKAAATWVYTQTKELVLAGFQSDGSVTKEQINLWFKEYSQHLEEVLQADMPKTFSVHEFNYLAVPHKKRSSTFAVTLVASESNLQLSDSETKLLQIYGHQLAVSYENTKLQEGSTVDALTKLFNAKFFHNRISSELLIAQQTESPLSLLLFDVDHFKKFNDTYGHTTGDLVLAEVAKVVKQTCRSSDIICRYGGEEFALILIDTETTGAQIVAEKIRTAVEKHLPDSSNPDIKVTISIGIATFPEHASGKEELIESSDEALYASKQAGRNRTSVYSK